MGRSLKREVWYQTGQFLYCERKKNVFKVRGPSGEFTLRFLAEGKCKVSGKNSRGERRKPHFNARSIEDAMEEAYKLLGFGDPLPGSELRINRVLGRWLESRNLRPPTRQSYRSYIKQFLFWCDAEGLDLWADLRLEHLERYRNQVVEEYDGWTPYHYLKVVRAASKWASINWRGEFQDFAEGFTLPKPAFRVLQEDADALSLVEVAEFCAWLSRREGGWRILPAVALCGLCGLRVTEALRLEWSRVNLEAGLVDITGEVKNPHSERRIPIPEFVVEILSQTPRYNHWVVPRNREKDAYGRAFRKFYDKWKPERRIVPSDLRDALQTTAEIEGWNGYVMERYVGHAPRTMSQRHYTKRSSEALIRDMRVQVASRIDAMLEKDGAKWPKNGPIDNVVQLRSVS